MLRSKSYSIVVSIIIGFLYSMGMVYNNYSLQSTVLQLILLSARFILVSCLTYFLIIPAVCKYSNRLFAPEDQIGKAGHVKMSLLLALCWLPVLIIRYPGTIEYDTWVCIIRFQKDVIDGMQPVFYCVLIGILIKWFGSDAGIFIYTLLQYAVICYSFGGAISYMESLGLKKPLKRVMFFLYLTCPYLLGYIGVTIKDVLYSTAVMNITLCLIRISSSKKSDVKDLAGILIWGVVIVLFRPNGIYLLAALVLFYIFSIIRRKMPVKPLFFIAAALVTGYGIMIFLNMAYNVQKPEYAAREALSIPFQQTARYVRDYGEDVTEQEREIIDKTIGYDTLAERYDPVKSDYVKEGYTGDSEYLVPYFKVWFKQFMRHPSCYFESFWEQNHYMFDIQSSTDNYRYFDESLDMWNKLLSTVCFSIMKFPIPWITSNVALSSFMVVFSLMIALSDRKRDSLIYYVPVLMTMLIALAGPVIQGHARYLFPVVYTAPLILFKELSHIGDSPCQTLYGQTNN